MNLKYQMTKISECVLKPLFTKPEQTWQAHHVTNPSVIRFTNDNRVFLGYRAGGDRDHYVIYDNDVFSSSLGLAILDEKGNKVATRFPYPIMKIAKRPSLPQSPEHYEAFVENHGKEICVMHDFRLYEHNNFLYVIYHDGRINMAFDCIKRMSVKTFMQKIEQSELLIKDVTAYTTIENAWSDIWWKDDTWEACGADGRLLFPTTEKYSFEMKTDVVYLQLANSIELNRRPLPDISYMTVSDDLYGGKTIDGFQEMGILEQCVRPGCYDNSHIGVNGLPTLATIYGKKVYIDIVHGVQNGALQSKGEFVWDMYYVPYLRIKDADDGKLLYYSDEPIIDPDDNVWEEYSRYGRWISAIPHTYITFAGGQTPQDVNNIDVDGVFNCYLGAGDSAIVRAEFTLRQLVPEKVLCDIGKLCKKTKPSFTDERTNLNEKPAGWNWSILNSSEKSTVCICREFDFSQGKDYVERPVNLRPGYFDADAIIGELGSVNLVNNFGYTVLYKGVRYTVCCDGKPVTEVGFGILVLDRFDPERIYFRTNEAIEGKIIKLDGHVSAEEIEFPADYVNNIMKYIPEDIVFGIKRNEELISEGKHWKSHHTIWLEERAK